MTRERKIYRFICKKIKHFKFPFKSNRLLIVRTDAIGDYVLFRNFLSEIKNSPKYSGYSISLLTRDVVKEISLQLDQDVVDKFYFVSEDILSLSDSLNISKILFVLKLKLQCFDIIINPMLSRSFNVDLFVEKIGAKELIASKGDMVNYGNEEVFIKTSSIYSPLLDSLDNSHFEFYRTQFFFEKLLNRTLDTKLEIPREKVKVFDFLSNYIVIIPGAGADHRRWSTGNFATLIDKIGLRWNKYNYIILGSAKEEKLAEEIIQKSKEKKIFNYAGKTSLVEYVNIISQASFLISNETSAIHIAASVQIPAICISNGNHFGRFNPYPKGISNSITTVYPSDDFYDEKEYTRLVIETQKTSDYDINLIEPNVVFNLFCNVIHDYERE